MERDVSRNTGKTTGMDERKEDGMVGWYHQLYRHEFEQTLGDGDGHGSLEYCNSWDHKDLDMTEQLNLRYADDTTVWQKAKRN